MKKFSCFLVFQSLNMKARVIILVPFLFWIMGINYLLIIAFILTSFALNLFGQTNVIDKTAWQELLAFKNQNLFDEKFSEKRNKAVELFNRSFFIDKELEDRKTYSAFFSLRYILEIENKNGGKNYGFMESPVFFMMPGQQTHTIYFFDTSGKLLNKEKFSTGWRMSVSKAEIIKNDSIAAPILRIDAGGLGGFNYADQSSQYYALLEKDVILIRLESNKKYAVYNLDNRNSYGCEYPAIGPKTPDRNVDEWVKSLYSEDKIKILQTLMWLGGSHKTIDQINQEQEEQERIRKQNPELEKWETTLEKCPDIIQKVQIYESVKNRQDVQKRIKELTNSSNSWIKEAAQLALTPIERKTKQ